MSVYMVCERKDGVCNLCGADPEEDCPLTDLSPEIAEWSAFHPSKHPSVVIIDPLRDILASDEPDVCESCQ